jgi:hypothetical protein
LSAFDLSRNPFIILGTSPRAGRGEINTAFQNKSLDAESPEEERVLDMARQALLTPRDRIIAEITYLLEMRPADVRRVLSVERANDWVKISNSTTGVARANALAQACTLSLNPQKRRELAERLIDAHGEISGDDLYHTLSEERAVAGFDIVSRKAVDAALVELTTIHANVIVENLSQHPNFASEVSYVIQENDKRGSQGQGLIRRVIEAYERLIAKDLDDRAEDVVAALRTFSAWSAKSGFDDFEAALSPVSTNGTDLRL